MRKPLILQNKIESEEGVICEWSDIDTEKGKNYQNVTDDIIKILGGFADMIDLPTACDLFFQYYFKRPDLYIEFYRIHAFVHRKAQEFYRSIFH